MRHLAPFLLLAACATAAYPCNSSTAPPLATDCEAGDDQDPMYVQRTNPPKLFICGPGGWVEQTSGQGDPSAAWPVGSIFITTSAANPSTLLGFGTWVAFGAGRVLVGLDAGQTEFDTIEETGGEKTHTLTVAEMPAHSHGVTDPGHTHTTQRYPTATGGSSGFTADTSMSGTPADNTLATKSATTGVSVNAAGGDGAHNNLQPYVVVHFWKRTS